jgi:ankyrin repeat protein
VNSGEWSIRSYHEYQRIAAATGNVDSARLMIAYGVAPSTELQHTALHSTNRIEMLHSAAMNCNDPSKLRSLLDDVGDSLESADRVDGTTLLMTATYANCSDIVQMILFDYEYDGLDNVASHGLNALMIAASMGHTAVLSLLIEGTMKAYYAYLI